jgi:hypothetical protein
MAICGPQQLSYLEAADYELQKRQVYILLPLLRLRHSKRFYSVLFLKKDKVAFYDELKKYYTVFLMFKSIWAAALYLIKMTIYGEENQLLDHSCLLDILSLKKGWNTSASSVPGNVEKEGITRLLPHLGFVPLI